ncbi:uncharacterized protein LOC101739818 isoform X1 [Bombyx mori]|uniref:Uncharacterized protein n=1 Tax=Bombyx mori TaxID=7091 RepID=A0A8R2DJY5_BOMMO|nr:uncharacterized protein LOC119628350 isoform X1 [Bombyx mori]
MIRQTLISRTPVILFSKDRNRCTWISIVVIIQCFLVYLGAATIIYCVWSPDNATLDYDILARIMYLYDSETCGYNLRASKGLTNIRLSNDTKGFNVRPIKWSPAIVTVSTRLSAKTRKYVNFSFGVHLIWNLTALALVMFTRGSSKIKHTKYALATFFYITSLITVCDISIAIVYIADIQQSLTKGMIIRYSGWSMEVKLRNYDDFGGWLPIIASICWLRGIVILIFNVYMCKLIYSIRNKIRMKEVGKRVKFRSNFPIPDAKINLPIDTNVLYYRRGEEMPFIMRDTIQNVFY